MNNAIFSFSKPTPNSTVISNHLAFFISNVLGLPVYYDSDIRTLVPDILFIVNGAFAFCDCLEELSHAIVAARRIVWIQNDYTIKPPKMEGDARSPFRRAFVERAGMGLPPTDYWTTVRVNASKTPLSEYINWNMLTYADTGLKFNRSGRDLFYYGAFRQNRRRYFDRYFKKPPHFATISTTSKAFGLMYPNVTIQPGIPRDFFYKELNSHGVGLYIEDPQSHTEYHSPANRFYEMLSASLPMVFQPESELMLRKAGYDITPFIVERRRDINLMISIRKSVWRKQQDWHGSYRAGLAQQVGMAYQNLIRRHTDGR
jgi:hypothetical protein